MTSSPLLALAEFTQNALGALAGLVMVAVWAWWKDRQNREAHAELMRRMNEMRDGFDE